MSSKKSIDIKLILCYAVGRKGNYMSRKQVTAQIHEEIFERIAKIAKKDDCPVARIVRKIINDWYEVENSNGEAKST